MVHHRIRQGLDIPIAGEASGPTVELGTPTSVSIDPREFRGLIPRLAVREGDRVQRGQPVLFHKFHPELSLVAAASGTVREVRRGARRVITDFVIDVDGDEVVQHRTWSASELDGISRDDAKAQMLVGGVWPFLRARPLDQLADPEHIPQAIFIVGTETGPLQPGADHLLSDDDHDPIAAAIKVLSAVTDGKVYLTHAEGSTSKALTGHTGVEVHTFSGPHPSGDPSVQISHVAPPSGGRMVWYIRAWDAARIGRLFLTGQFDSRSVYAAIGTGVKQTRFVHTLLGAPVSEIVGAVGEGEQRFIRGSVLTGDRTQADGWAGSLTHALHVMAEKVDRRIFGWALPQPGLWSFHRTFLSAFGGGSKRYDMQPGLHGGHRAIIPIGAYDRVVATPDIVPDFLFKSIISEDLEGSIQLGLLDISEEEAALCAFICPSKTNFDVILRKGLETYAREA